MSEDINACLLVRSFVIAGMAKRHTDSISIIINYDSITHNYSEIVDINRLAGDSMRVSLTPMPTCPCFFSRAGEPRCRAGRFAAEHSSMFPFHLLNVCPKWVCAIGCDHAECTASWQNQPRRMSPYKMYVLFPPKCWFMVPFYKPCMPYSAKSMPAFKMPFAFAKKMGHL